MKKSRRSLWIAGAAIGTAVVLGIGATTFVLFVNAQRVSRPEAIVSSYLTDVQHGRIEAAMRMEGRTPAKDDILLTDKAYAKVTERLSSFRITALHSLSDTRTRVDVLTRVGDQDGESSFTLVRGPWTAAALFGLYSWRLERSELSTVDVQVGAPGEFAAHIAGTGFDWSGHGGPKTYQAFPGSYSLEVTTDSRWFTVPGADTTVSGFGQRRTLTALGTLSAQGLAAAESAAMASLGPCLAQGGGPTGCSFETDDPASSGEVWSNASWTLLSPPVVNVATTWSLDCRPSSPDGTAGCWSVTTAKKGTADFHADYHVAATGERGTIYLPRPADVAIEGSVADFGDAGATFQSISWQ
jgi:hypothetical protein